MMNQTNFDLFNQIALHCLVKLFDEFPNEIELNAHSLALDAIPQNEHKDSEAAWDLMELGINTITWLKSEGFISFKNRAYGGEFFQVRLTLKGLSLLGYSLPRHNEPETLIEQAKEVLKDASVGSAKEIMTKLFMTGLCASSGVIG